MLILSDLSNVHVIRHQPDYSTRQFQENSISLRIAEENLGIVETRGLWSFSARDSGDFLNFNIGGLPVNGFAGKNQRCRVFAFAPPVFIEAILPSWMISVAHRFTTLMSVW
ncbi:MAG TPA: hypothetical protein EYG03_07290, partial [Planctomycetes bacterium]|nr:hypothetical protein [Planctomycetota bacterium]